jgi:hypothetical protein
LAELSVWWGQCARDLAELSVCGQCTSDFLAELPVPVIWQNCLYVDSVPVIWQNCLSWDSVPVIWENSLHVEERASDLAGLPVPVTWQNCLSGDSVPVIWQN